MYYEYLHQDGLSTEWLYCTVIDPTIDDQLIRIKYKLGPDEIETKVPVHQLRLVHSAQETSQ